jgi:hypothetical protein
MPMKTKQLLHHLAYLKEFYDSIPSPKYRNVDLATWKVKFGELQSLKDDLAYDKEYQKLANAMSQIIAKLERFLSLTGKPQSEIWSNMSDRGMNKAIPPVLERVGQTLPVKWNDKWGNTCSVSNGYWGAKNYRVMDVLSYMFLRKVGGDRLPKDGQPIFNDLRDIIELENQLYGNNDNVISTKTIHYIRFTDDQFRKASRLRISSAEIMTLLLETSRVEFKLTFPVRLKSTGARENIHSMNYYSRFFELRHDDLSVRSDGVVLSRQYKVSFNTFLGELTVNNLLAKFNDPIDIRLYLLPDSAQIFYRRALSHNNFPKIPFNLSKIAELTGLIDTNQRNLAATVETNILGPLKEHGYIESYEKVTENCNEPKYVIKRATR